MIMLHLQVIFIAKKIRYAELFHALWTYLYKNVLLIRVWIAT